MIVSLSVATEFDWVVKKPESMAAVANAENSSDRKKYKSCLLMQL